MTRLSVSVLVMISVYMLCQLATETDACYRRTTVVEDDDEGEYDETSGNGGSDEDDDGSGGSGDDDKSGKKKKCKRKDKESDGVALSVDPNQSKCKDESLKKLAIAAMAKGGAPWTIASEIEKSVDYECSVVCAQTPIATAGGCYEECQVDADHMHCLITILDQ